VIDSVTTVGDAGDISCWSGTPFHFAQAARSMGWKAEPWRIDLRRFRWPRRFWNIRRYVGGNGIGGYQYSDSFAKRALAMVNPSLLSGRILSFSQHFPALDAIHRAHGTAYLYLDATFPLLLSRYRLGGSLSPGIQKEALEKEHRSFRLAERLVFFQRWSAESAVRDCGADPAIVSVICPGANIELPPDWDFAYNDKPPSTRRPLVLGFVGKDWRRKGLPYLLEVRRSLAGIGIPTVIRCAGGVPEPLPDDGVIDHWGFIDKNRNPERFHDFLKGCDIGCLFSEAEASSIAVLEFLHAGIPVAGFTVDGMTDLFPPDAGFRFEPGTPPDRVADQFSVAFQNAAEVARLRRNARAWSPLVTWERCLREWKELLQTGKVLRPVELWRGLEHSSPL
jgi:glycosyltransferase involved in cell wall biosynthesis